MRKSTKHPEEMTLTELVAATEQFEKPFAFLKGKPLTRAQRTEERALRRGRGRPRIGKGAKKVSISLETDLLRRADALAKRRGVNRSELIAEFVISGMRRRAV